MIVFFGPAGAGKSVQGQILASRHGWRWLSMGQMLRDTKDAGLVEIMHRGELIDSAKTNEIMNQALVEARDIENVILDGYPREINQATWLIEHKADHNREVDLVIVLEVPRDEILKRLQLRGRADDTPEAIDRRLTQYRSEIYPILEYFNAQNIPIVHMDGVGNVGAIHDRIEAELVGRGISKG